MDLYEILDALSADEWEPNDMEDGLICPCGDEIEMDGTCDAGHISPLLEAGMI